MSLLIYHQLPSIQSNFWIQLGTLRWLFRIPAGLAYVRKLQEHIYHNASRVQLTEGIGIDFLDSDPGTTIAPANPKVCEIWWQVPKAFLIGSWPTRPAISQFAFEVMAWINNPQSHVSHLLRGLERSKTSSKTWSVQLRCFQWARAESDLPQGRKR